MDVEVTQLGETLRNLLTLAWLLPLAGFAVEIFGGFWGTRKSKTAAHLAVDCIGIGFLASATALLVWGNATGWSALKDHHTAGHGTAQGETAAAGHGATAPAQAHGAEGAHPPAAAQPVA